ncbi:methionyl-tRNA formyltransferase [Flagellimonas sp.]|uniref:methionyl-tRNA formyltransferase n=1 Tax=Flagellimonas sp. TaxID=2058762 RepID=UPI003BAF56AB
MISIGILCSGLLGLGTLVKIAEDYPIKFIMTDRNSEGVISFAEQHLIPFYAGNPRGGKGFDFLKEFEVDVIASINYLFLIEEDIIGHSNKLTFNVHGSLLPKYRGRTPHVWAIINGEKKTGITAHQIDVGCDTGKIIHQIEIPIEEEDTGAQVLKKYSEEYYPLVKKVLQDVLTDQLKLIPQNDADATYFGKRTPADGEINWNWPKEAIKNWVRAQAFPYPGAFAFCDGQKIIIDKVSISKVETESEQKNGEIIQTAPTVVVKTSNGALSLDEIRDANFTLTVGKILRNENRE